MGGSHDFEVEEYTGGSYVTHLVAGAVAGTAEHCGMFPVDTIKTHLQAKIPGAQSARMADITKNIVSRSGFTGLFRGLTAMAAGAGPAHAVHFAIYESCKYQFGGGDPGHHPFRVGAAGMVATLASEAVLCPTDAIKQRMQLHLIPYKGLLDCIVTVTRRDGIRALYSGYTTTLTMNVPFQAIYFASYESLVKVIKGSDIKNDHYSPLTHMVAGGGAGMISAGLTNPFDVARTRLQTQGETALLQSSSFCSHSHTHTITCTPPLNPSPLPFAPTLASSSIAPSPSSIPHTSHTPAHTPTHTPPPHTPTPTNTHTHYRGMLDAMRTIWREEGLAGYTRGIKPRMVFHSMSAAILWSVYEYMKILLDPQEIK
eukprot:Phypoly_transcript_11393.p1 GENE.Phypoly_transcript_11393~~Phypoly_transcript_11393.p1  ORF type:complete len:370 (+),score=55.24 Phypoly_transcript_11393:55-1164(+)